jgi:hypothetical protein
LKRTEKRRRPTQAQTSKLLPAVASEQHRRVAAWMQDRTNLHVGHERWQAEEELHDNA